MATDKFQVKKGIQITGTGSVTASYALVPIGTIGMWMSTTIPEGWIECAGGTFQSTTYPDLATVLGNTYGTASGTTYYLPDFRGRVALGAKVASPTPTVSQWGGLETVTVTDDMVTHTHTQPHTHPLGSHSHSNSGHYNTSHPGSHTHTLPQHTHPFGAASSSHTHAMWFNNTGAPGTSTPRNNTTGSANTVHSDTQGSHTHSLTMDAPTTDFYRMTATVETSSDASPSTTADASPSATGSPSVTSTPTYTGTTPTVNIVQQSYALRYIMRAY